MAVTEDAATPAPQSPVNASSGVATSNAFTPPSGTYVVVCVSWLFTNNATATLTCKDSAGTSYSSLAQKQDGNSATINAVFGHYYASSPGSITAKVTCSNTGSAGAVLAPRVLDGAASDQTGAASNTATGTSTTWTLSLTTTTTGSMVYVVGGATSTETLTATGGNTALINTVSSGTFGDSGANGKSTSTTGTPGATTFGFSSTGSQSWGLAAVEIIPAAAPSGPTPTNDPAGISVSPVWENVFGVLSHIHKDPVLFDFRPQFAGQYITAGDLALGANTAGLGLIPVNDPPSILPSPAWSNQFQPYLGKKAAVLFDREPFHFSGHYLTAGDLAFGAVTTAVVSIVLNDRSYSIAGPPFRNQFQQNSLTKQAVRYDRVDQRTGSTTLNIAFGATSTGVAVIPGTVPAPIAIPGPALLNRFPVFAAHRKLAVVHQQPYETNPFGPWCFGGTGTDTNLYGGTETETNLLGGTEANANLLGGTEADTNLLAGTVSLGCAPQVINITFGEFNDETIDVTLDNSGIPFNLNAYNLQVLLKTSAGVLDADPSTIILGAGNIVITNAPAGTAVITIPNNLLANTNIGFWRLDVVQGSNQSTAIYGTVTMRAL